MIQILIGAIAIFCAYFFYFYINNKKYFDFTKKYNLPGPPFVPFIGSLYALAGQKINSLVDVFIFLINNYGLPVSFWIRHTYFYVTSDPEDIKVLMNHPDSINKAIAYSSELELIFKNSILILPGNIWKQRRRLHAKTFKPSILKSLVPVFYERSQVLLELIKNKEDDADLFHFFDIFFCKNSFGSLFGYKGKDLDVVNTYADLVKGVQERLAKRLVHPIITTKNWLRYFPEGRKAMQIVTDAREIVRKALQKTMELGRSEGIVQDLPHVDILMNDKSLTEEEIFEDLAFFVAAATETSGHSLAFTLILLGMHPEIQEKVYQEVISAVGDKTIEYDDLVHLQYTECAIQESLRCCTISPILGRYVEKEIDTGKHIIPAGTNVFIISYDTHRNAKYWKDPLKYDPSRFSAENIKKIVPYSYLPFSHGPRDCVGKTYAMMQLKVNVANVVRSYRIESNHKSIEEFDMTAFVTAKCRNKMDCRFYKRM